MESNDLHNYSISTFAITTPTSIGPPIHSLASALCFLDRDFFFHHFLGRNDISVMALTDEGNAGYLTNFVDTFDLPLEGTHPPSTNTIFIFLTLTQHLYAHTN